VGEFAPDEVSRLSKLKKAAVVSEAERLVSGIGWMPAQLWAESSVGESESEDMADADTVIAA